MPEKKEEVILNKLPETLEEAINTILSGMSLPDRLSFKRTRKDDLIMYHSTLGMQIRNSFGLWSGNPLLVKDMKLKDDTHPDEVSFEIIKALWERIQKD